MNFDCEAHCHQGSTIRVTVLLLKYKASFPIVLLADADANCCFQVTDVGEPVARGVILVGCVNVPLDRDSSRDTWEFHYPPLFLEL